MAKRNLPWCQQQLRNCFAYTPNGFCSALTGTTFGRPCPFFKTKEQYHKEYLEEKQRKLERKRKDDDWD